MNNVIDPDFSEVDQVNDKLMKRVDAIHEALRAGAEREEDLYQLLVGMLGVPISTQFKVEFRNGNEIVVGGRMVFKGDEISRHVTIDEMELSMRGKVMGGASASFGGFELDEPAEIDDPFQLALVEMFAKMYAQNKA